MNTVGQRKNRQRQKTVIFTFGLLMLLYAASKNPNLPSEWTGMHKAESGIQIPKSSSECGSD
jgi:hypothetical protein